MSANSRLIAVSLRLQNATYKAMHEKAAEVNLSHNAFIERAIEFYVRFGCASISVNGISAKLNITAPHEWR